MATGIVNPYAVAGENTDYRDAVLADSPLGLWMLDEPYGNNVATNQGSVSSGDGGYYGNMQLASSRGLRKVFNIDVAGASFANSNVSAGAGLGFYGGSVSVPYNNNFNTVQVPYYSGNTWEWVTRVDHQAPGAYQWMIRRTELEHVIGIDTSGRYFSQRQYLQPAGGWYVWSASNSAASNVYGLGQDKHHVLRFGYFPTGHRAVSWHVNGSLEYQVTLSPSYLQQKVPTTSPMIFGSYYQYGGPSYSLLGAMGGVAYYDYALSQAQITAHYNALLT
jgi:hypothetical protein